jgi:hypothetical protein
MSPVRKLEGEKTSREKHDIENTAGWFNIVIIDGTAAAMVLPTAFLFGVILGVGCSACSLAKAVARLLITRAA